MVVLSIRLNPADTVSFAVATCTASSHQETPGHALPSTEGALIACFSLTLQAGHLTESTGPCRWRRLEAATRHRVWRRCRQSWAKPCGGKTMMRGSWMSWRPSLLRPASTSLPHSRSLQGNRRCARPWSMAKKGEPCHISMQIWAFLRPCSVEAWTPAESQDEHD